MGDELRKWCEENEFDVGKFNALDLSLEKLAETRSVQISVLAEQLGMTTSKQRGRFIDAVKELKQNMNVPASPIINDNEQEIEDEEVGNYDDPEVIVKGNDGGDYNEFEEQDEKKSLQEDSFMLRSNFSDAPQDQWNIVEFFDANEKFKKFKPILLLQMQIQNSANYNGDGAGMGDQNQQLDGLLDAMLGAGHQNDSSSDVKCIQFFLCVSIWRLFIVMMI